MLVKEVVFRLDSNNTEVLTGELVKTAAFTLPAGHVYSDNFLYLKVKAVSAGEYWGSNKNKDMFPEAELKLGYPSFLAAKVFKNHENKQVENAIGDVLSAEYDDYMHCVTLVLRINKKVAPSIVAGFQDGHITDVSMGCRVKYSVCSICGNKAKTKMEYCSHIKYEGGQVYDDGRMVYEINVAPRFHDISVVLNGAERSAKVIDMKLDLNSKSRPKKTLKEAFEFEEGLAKVASDGTEPMEIPFYKETRATDPLEKGAAIRKLADIKKEITGKIISQSAKDFYKNKIRGMTMDDETADKAKVLSSSYLSQEKCVSLGKDLAETSDSYKAHDGDVFGDFLLKASYSGIDFTPMEMYRIYKAMKGPKSSGETPSLAPPVSAISGMMRRFHRTPPLFSVLRGLSNVEPMLSGISQGQAPLRRGITLILKSAPQSMPTPSFPVGGIIRKIAHDKSNSIGPLTNRLEKIASGDIEVSLDEAMKDYAPLAYLEDESLIKTAEDLSMALMGYVWLAYQNDRLEQTYEEDFDKKALEAVDEYGLDIEKTADKQGKPKKKFGLAKSIFTVYPATHVYSAFQRSRMRGGKRVSSLNRYVAENPDQAAMVASILAPGVVRGASSIKTKASTGAKKATGSVKSGFKSATGAVRAGAKKATNLISQNKGKAALIGGGAALAGAAAYAGYKALKKRSERKRAEDLQRRYQDYINRVDVTQSPAISENLQKQGFTEQQEGICKFAHVARQMDREDLASTALMNFNLTASDENKYLQKLAKAVTMEFDKSTEYDDVILGAMYNEYGDSFEWMSDHNYVAKLTCDIINS